MDRNTFVKQNSVSRQTLAIPTEVLHRSVLMVSCDASDFLLFLIFVNILIVNSGVVGALIPSFVCLVKGLTSHMTHY